ncbi:hypothetical protein B0H12DRAFT_1226792 [Mycena haematopus]|nr:hypothetical protein B0H12DRAFT_1226792 [Mycena haematopus]
MVIDSDSQNTNDWPMCLAPVQASMKRENHNAFVHVSQTSGRNSLPFFGSNAQSSFNDSVNSLFTTKRSQSDPGSELLNMDYTIAPTTFAVYWEFAVSRLYGVYAEILLYGVLLVLLCIAIHGLNYWTGGARKSLAVATFLMALLATLQVIVHVGVTLLGLEILRLEIEGETWPASPTRVRLTTLNYRLYAVKDFLLVTNNLVTDSLFIYRCFFVWGRNIRVVVLPMLLLLTTTVLGYLSAYEDDLVSPYFIDDRVIFVMVIVTNVVLMTLTAGRIWWIRRDAIIVLESAYVRKYDTVVAIILESGAIYCFSIIIFLISVSVSKSDNAPITQIFRSSLPQIMNIAPTLIIVRVGMSHTVGGGISEDRCLPQEQLTAPVGHSGSNSSSFVIDIGVRQECDLGAGISMSDLGREA